MFIYVMDAGIRDTMLAMGYRLLKAMEEMSIWCFENKEPENYELVLDFPHVISSVMTF